MAGVPRGQTPFQAKVEKVMTVVSWVIGIPIYFFVVGLFTYEATGDPFSTVAVPIFLPLFVLVALGIARYNPGTPAGRPVRTLPSHHGGCQCPHCMAQNTP